MNENYSSNENYSVDIVNTDPEVAVSTRYFTTFESIGVRLGSALRQAFNDYIGVDFKFNNGNIIPRMFFQTGGISGSDNDGRVRAYAPMELVQTNNTAIGRQFQELTKFAKSKHSHKITKEGMEVLSSFVYCNKPNDFNWDRNFDEEVVTSFSGGRQFSSKRIIASGFDFVKILRFVKIGGIDDLDNEFKYRITCSLIDTPSRVITTHTPYQQILLVDVFNMKETDEVARKYGIGASPQLQMMDASIITPDMPSV